MRKRTAEDMVADVRNRAAMVNSKFVTDEEILEYLNQERVELDSHLARNEGHLHKVSNRDIQVLQGTKLYDLPEDFWELVGAECVIGGIRRRLDSYMQNEHAGLQNAPLSLPFDSPRYRLMGSQIEIVPSVASFVLTIYYRPVSKRLRLGQTPPDTIDGYNGYEMAMIYGATATCLAKEESDPGFWLDQKMRIYKIIDANAANRDAGTPERVSDVTAGLMNDLLPWVRW